MNSPGVLVSGSNEYASLLGDVDEGGNIVIFD